MKWEEWHSAVKLTYGCRKKDWNLNKSKKLTTLLVFFDLLNVDTIEKALGNQCQGQEEVRRTVKNPKNINNERFVILEKKCGISSVRLPQIFIVFQTVCSICQLFLSTVCLSHLSSFLSWNLQHNYQPISISQLWAYPPIFYIFMFFKKTDAT